MTRGDGRPAPAYLHTHGWCLTRGWLTGRALAAANVAAMARRCYVSSRREIQLSFFLEHGADVEARGNLAREIRDGHGAIRVRRARHSLTRAVVRPRAGVGGAQGHPTRVDRRGRIGPCWSSRYRARVRGIGDFCVPSAAAVRGRCSQRERRRAGERRRRQARIVSRAVAVDVSHPRSVQGVPAHGSVLAGRAPHRGVQQRARGDGHGGGGRGGGGWRGRVFPGPAVLREQVRR